MRNIEYKSAGIKEFYASHRTTWGEFYLSERLVMEKMGLCEGTKVLDVGCGCGGLGMALFEKYGVSNYTGVEINRQAAEYARFISPSARIFDGDFLELSYELGEGYDVVVNFSCADWNLNFYETLSAAWSKVTPGGFFLSTFRLTIGDGCDDFMQSYQFINFNGSCEGERAPYVVLNAQRLFGYLLGGMEPFPDYMIAKGYYGTPSDTAITPYDELCFVAVAIRKPICNDSMLNRSFMHDIDLPEPIKGAVIASSELGRF